MALGLATASAETFTDYYSVSYEGAPVENGGYIEASHWDADAGWIPCDIVFTPKTNQSSFRFNVLGEYTGSPSYEMQSGNTMGYGTPSICYKVGAMGNCITNEPPIISDFDLTSKEQSEGDIQVSANEPIEIQFHLIGEYRDFNDPGFNAADPSTYTIKPVYTSHYLVTFSATVDGKPATDTFSINVIIGNDPAGVDDVAVDSEAPVYYDMHGRRVLNPSKGQLVIERRGSKAVKVIK